MTKRLIINILIMQAVMMVYFYTVGLAAYFVFGLIVASLFVLSRLEVDKDVPVAIRALIFISDTIQWPAQIFITIRKAYQLDAAANSAKH